MCDTESIVFIFFFGFMAGAMFIKILLLLDEVRGEK
jgi:hypothetical protein